MWYLLLLLIPFVIASYATAYNHRLHNRERHQRTLKNIARLESELGIVTDEQIQAQHYFGALPLQVSHLAPTTIVQAPDPWESAALREIAEMVTQGKVKRHDADTYH